MTMLQRINAHYRSRLRRTLPVLLLAALAVLPLVALGQNAEVTLSARQQGEVWAGEQITLDLDLKTSEQSFANIFFDIPEVSGAFLLRTDSSTSKLSERRGSETWQVLRYPLSLFVPQGKTITVPAFEVRFQTSGGFGTEPTDHRLSTPELRISVSQPPGVDPGDLVVSSPGLQVDYSWDMPADPVKPGDAVTLTVQRRSQKVSAMLLPPVPVFETPGLASYPAAPELEDRSNRGSLTGERTDRITWIVEEAGVYDIPPIRFRWWDPQREQLRDQLIDGASFEVIAPPGAAPDTQHTPPRDGFPGRSALFWIALALALCAVLYWQRDRLALIRQRVLPKPRTLLKRLNPGQRP